MKLFIKLLNFNLTSNYERKHNYDTDCGFDLYQENITVPAGARGFAIKFGIACEPSETRGYYLYPRSSISKTPLRLANSVGIIDPTYRGEIIAKVDNLSDQDFVLQNTTSLFQLCNPDLTPIKVDFVTELTSTERGTGGFGSTH
jgi:dUTP pyrophosphatase